MIRHRDEAARELRRLGRTVPNIRARVTAGDGVRGLSGREREIAELAAEAKTNREIAATLFISEKTIEKHLTKVFAKLGVKGRAAIGAELVTHGNDDRAGATSARKVGTSPIVGGPREWQRGSRSNAR